MYAMMGTDGNEQRGERNWKKQNSLSGRKNGGTIALRRASTAAWMDANQSGAGPREASQD